MASLPQKKTGKSTDLFSRRHIRCGHCNVQMRRYRLATHTKDSHPGKKPIEKGQSTLATMFAGPSVRRSDDPEKKGTDDSDDSGDQPSGDEPQLQEIERSETVQQISEEGGSREAISEAGSDNEGGEHTNVQGADDERVTIALPTVAKRRTLEEDETSDQGGPVKRIRLDNTEKLENLMTDLIRKLEASNIHQISEAPVETGMDTEKDNLVCLVSRCRSRQRLCELAFFTPYDEYIVCLICHPNGHDLAQGVSGVMKYDSLTSGSTFDTKSMLPREFVNLKRSVARHITSKSHCDNEMKLKDDKEQQIKSEAKNFSIGMVLGRAAYKITKLTRPYVDYEADMYLYSRANIDIGDLNHSQRFPSVMLDAFSKVTDSRIVNYIQTPLDGTMARPPVGIVADKVTTRRRTGQLFGAILFTPGETNLLTAVSLGLESVKGHTGDALAESIKDACQTYDIQPAQISAFGFDGQYIKLHVDEHLVQKMNLPKDIPMNWDMAHLLQLAENDARPQFVNDVCNVIADVLKGFSYGKMFEELIERAEELGINLKAPQWFSTTRFATFAHGVFATFANNYPAIRSVLEEVAASSDTKKSHEASDSLRRINNQGFVIKLLLCMDIFKSIGDLSLQLQQVNCEIWRKGSEIRKFVESLNQGNFEPMLVNLRKYSDDVKGFEFCGFPLLRGKGSGLMLPHRQTRLQFSVEGAEAPRTSSDDDPSTVSSNMLNEWTTKMKDEMKKRFKEDLHQRIDRARDAAALMPVLCAARECTNQQAFLAHDAVVNIRNSHRRREESCRNLCLNIFNKRNMLNDCHTDIDVYHKVFTSQDLYTGAQHALQHVACEICSAPPEAVVESMGSITELICKVRGGGGGGGGGGGSKSSTKDTSVSRLSQELKVHWNGPEVSVCDGVVRQALNMHFKGGKRHFKTHDIRARMHKVSVVVDRIERARSKLSFMK